MCMLTSTAPWGYELISSQNVGADEPALVTRAHKALRFFQGRQDTGTNTQLGEEAHGTSQHVALSGWAARQPHGTQGRLTAPAGAALGLRETRGSEGLRGARWAWAQPAAACYMQGLHSTQMLALRHQSHGKHSTER